MVLDKNHSTNDEVKYSLGGTLFTWDDDKALMNWKKHGVSFQDAADVFADVYAIDLPDVRHMEEEERRRIIGRMAVKWKILFVVYVERTIKEDVNVFRIVSARPATSKERRLYENGISR